MTKQRCASICLLLAMVFESSRAYSGETHLISVGVNQGLPQEPPLRYAHRDAEAFAEVLAHRGTLEAVGLRVLLEPSKSQLADALAALSLRSEPEDVVFFYFSGHGDRRSLHLGAERVDLQQLEAQLAKVPASLRVLVIDACRSEDGTQAKGWSRAPRFQVDTTAKLTGTVILHAASEGEQAQESSELEGAVFTHALVVGLRGAADVDADGQVTLSELYRYAFRQTVLRSSASSGEIMHPSVELDLEGAGEIVLAQQASLDARLLLPQTAEERFLLFHRPSGNLVAEVWSDPERPVEIPVREGRYLIHRRRSNQGSVAVVEVKGSEPINLDETQFRAVELSLLQAKGGHLQLETHELRAGAGLAYQLGLGPSARLGWNYGGPSWRFGLEGGVVQATYSGSERDFEAWGLDTELRLIRRFGTWEVSAGPFARFLHVSSRSREADVLARAQFSVSEHDWGFGFGPRIRWAWRGLSRGPFALEIALLGSGLILREEGSITTEWVFRPEGSLELGFRWEL